MLAAADVLVQAATEIVPYVASPYDVRALLLALPGEMPSAPLAALLTLLLSPAAFLEQWPTICLEDVALHYRPLALLALPVLPSIAIRRFRDLPISGDRELMAFLTTWPITSIHDPIDDWDVDLVAAALPRCTRLVHIGVSTSVFARLHRRLPQRVRQLSLARDLRNRAVHADATNRVDMTPLVTWFGRVMPTRLCLEGVGNIDTAFVAYELATLPSLQSLELRSTEVEGSDIGALIDAVVANKETFRYVTELCLHGLHPASIAQLLMLVDRRTLTHLDVRATGDLSFLVESLATLPVLETLCLGHCTLDVMYPPNTHCGLCNVSFDTCLVSTQTAHMLLDWTCHLPRLQRVSFRNVKFCGASSMQCALHYWLEYADIMHVRLAGCNLDEDAAVAIATGLGSFSSSTRPLSLDLVQNDRLRPRGLRCLVDALVPIATSTLRVTLRALERDEIPAYARHQGMIVTDSGEDVYTFCSTGRTPQRSARSVQPTARSVWFRLWHRVLGSVRSRAKPSR